MVGPPARAVLTFPEARVPGVCSTLREAPAEIGNPPPCPALLRAPPLGPHAGMENLALSSDRFTLQMTEEGQASRDAIHFYQKGGNYLY